MGVHACVIVAVIVAAVDLLDVRPAAGDSVRNCSCSCGGADSSALVGGGGEPKLEEYLFAGDYRRRNRCRNSSNYYTMLTIVLVRSWKGYICISTFFCLFCSVKLQLESIFFASPLFLGSGVLDALVCQDFAQGLFQLFTC